MISHHTRLREKMGIYLVLVRFGHRTKAANFFSCTHLSRVKRKAIVKNNFHYTLGEPPYHGNPWRTYPQYSVIICSIHGGTDSKVVELKRDNTFCCLLAEHIHSLVGVARRILYGIIRIALWLMDFKKKTGIERPSTQGCYQWTVRNNQSTSWKWWRCGEKRSGLNFVQ